MTTNNPISCEEARNKLDELLESMVQARIDDRIKNISASESSRAQAVPLVFEPQGLLKEHLDICSDCHNYQLANRVIIEGAKSLPLLPESDSLSDSIMAMVQMAQEEIVYETAVAPATAQSSNRLTWQNKHSFLLLLASFALFTVMSGGVFSGGFNQEELWSTGSWILALLAVALFKPLIENPLILAGQHSTAKASI